MDLLNGYPICKDAVSQFKFTPDSLDVLGLMLRVCYCQGVREPGINREHHSLGGLIVDSPEILLYSLLDLKISK